MKIFTIYSSDQDPIESAKFVQDGFCVSAMLFNVFWLLYYRLWAHAILFGMIYLGLIQLNVIGTISSLQHLLLNLMVSVYIGITGREYYGKNLERHGYHINDIVTAYDIDDAEYKYISKIYSRLNEEIQELVDEKANKSA